MTGGKVGVPFVWPIRGPGAVTYSSSGLPSGLSVHQTSGLISGTPVQAGAFDSTIIASNLYGVATQALRIVVGSADGLLFRDDFTGGFASGWEPLPADTSYYALTNGCQMWLRANNGDTWTSFNRPLNLFTIPAPGSNDWIATLAVTRYEPTSQDYNALLLVAWDDTDNNVRAAYGGGTRNLGISAENAQVMASYGTTTNLGTTPFQLRLIKEGNRYTTSFSTNGVDFRAAVTNVVTMGDASPAKIGFWMGIDPSYANTALLDYFEVIHFPPFGTYERWAWDQNLRGGDTNRLADPDGDGLENYYEFALGLNPTAGNAGLTLPVPELVNDRLTLTYRQRSGGTGTVGVNYTANGFLFRVEVADTLDGPWTSNTSLVEQMGATTSNGDGTENVTVRLKQPVTGAAQRFMRLTISP